METKTDVTKASYCMKIRFCFPSPFFAMASLLGADFRIGKLVFVIKIALCCCLFPLGNEGTCYWAFDHSMGSIWALYTDIPFFPYYAERAEPRMTRYT